MADDFTGAALPTHYAVGFGQRIWYVFAIAAAVSMLVWLAARLLNSPSVEWWCVASFVLGIAAADLLSGLVHWGADTWGRDDLPVIGHRVLVPFRIHHVNPDDFLQRSFLDTNGDVAPMFVPVLGGALSMPIDNVVNASIAAFVVGLSLVGLLTNQTHQWAHMSTPPRLIRWCQDRRLILGRRAHAAHHAQPYDVGYCIATGWCNRPLEAIGFFRRLERLVTAVTGAEPRRDDDRYARAYVEGG